NDNCINIFSNKVLNDFNLLSRIRGCWPCLIGINIEFIGSFLYANPHPVKPWDTIDFCNQGNFIFLCCEY
ncbi:hypothetical protein AE23_05162, partial [Klebsiella pneumoniae UCI 64]